MSDLKIKVDGKDYPLPDITVEQWKKVLIAYDKAKEKFGNSASPADPNGLDLSVEFFYLLLHDTYPELTRNKLGKMPVHQVGMMFTGKVVDALMEVPLDSVPPSDEKAKA